MAMTPGDSRLQRPIQSSVHLAFYVLLPLSIFILASITFALIYRQSPTPSDALSADSTTPSPVATTSVVSSQSEKIDNYLTIDNTLRDVNFCGKTYRAKQIRIDGIDVVLRIAEIITENEASKEKDIFVKSVCRNIEFDIIHQFDTEGHLIPSELPIGGPVIRRSDSGMLTYILGMGRFIAFVINYPSLQIEIGKAEEGASTVFGTLK